MSVTTAAVGAWAGGTALQCFSCAKGLVGNSVGLAANVSLLNAKHWKDAVEKGARSTEEGKIGLTIAGADRSQRQHGREEERQPHGVSMRCHRQESCRCAQFGSCESS